MRIKSSSFVAILVVLIAATAYFYVGLDFRDRKEYRKGGVGNSMSRPEAANFDEFHKKINEASGSSQFEAIADELVKKLPDERAHRLMELLLDRWIEQALGAALDFISDLEEKDPGQTLLQYALVEGAYFDFHKVMDWVNRQPESRRRHLSSLLYENVGKDNPEYALSFIELVEAGEFKELVMRALLEQWWRRDPAAALSWMSTQELPQALADLKSSLLSELMDRDPQEAGGLIRNMQPGHEKNSLARKYADLIAGTDIQAAAGWARSLDDADSYGIALTAVYEAWFQKEPDKKLIMEQVLFESDSELRDRLINEIALDIANNNPEELASVVERLPESAQPDVAEKAVRFWKDRDRQQALQWVNSLASGPVRDRATKVMVEDFLLRSDQEGAMSMASTIQDGSMRYESVKSAAAYWYQRNPAEADQMLEGISFLSESEKESISRHLRQTYR